MKRIYFGTDGVRGEFGGPVINPGFAWRLGVAAGRWLKHQPGKGGSVLIGHDTRASGPVLLCALAAGLEHEGVATSSLGVVPTPAVSLAVRRLNAALGVVVTASHNPAADNGIKFFASTGIKLHDSAEAAIEALLPGEEEVPAGALEPRSLEVTDAESLYIERLATILPHRALAGWKIVVDTANGAAYRTTPAVLRRLGADLVLIGDAPNGSNINAGCGSQHPMRMCSRVTMTGALLGLAHDGDADRLILADETGAVVDGDEILALLAGHALRARRLNQRTLVATVQSNLGLKRFMEEAGGRLVQTDVGDRYVIEAMLAGGYNLGGESSGHIICTDISPCGDGLAAALLVMDALRTGGSALSEARRKLRKFPQETRAIKVARKPDIDTVPELAEAIRAVEARLGTDGRVLVRYSGTEPKIRLLVEGAEPALVSEMMAILEAAVARTLTG
jgi:phosphoglucosamine mutase